MQPKNWIKLCLMLSIIGTFIQVASYVAPMWAWIQKGHFYLGVGLWFSAGCGCVLVSGNKKVNIDEEDLYYMRWDWQLLRGAETVAVIGSLLVCIFIASILISWKNARCFKIGSIIVSIITWIFIFGGVIGYGALFHPELKYFGLVVSVFPWSLVISLVAGVIFFLVFIFLVCMPPLDSVSGDPISRTAHIHRSNAVASSNHYV